MIELGKGTVLLDIGPRGVATVTLNRPDVNNAYNADLLRGVHEAVDAALESLEASAPVRCVIVRGTGRHFQAGADLTWLAEVQTGTPGENLEASRLTAEAVNRLNQLPVPVIAVVQGACFGGGTGVLAACDVVLAAESAIFSIGEVKWGLHPSIILPQLADAIGPRQLRRYALTGERFDAKEAARIGLVHEVLATDQLEEKIDEIVDSVLTSAPGGIATTKRLARESSWSGFENDAFDVLINEHSQARQSAEAIEGLSAFSDRRTPDWSSTDPSSERE